jgi:uncharacterized membrane protein YhaH (DUF805 family)
VVSYFVTAFAFFGGIPIILLIHIPIFWFICTQGAKRCHDLGNNGWWQIIPFYGIWMLFVEGSFAENKYGPSPK